MSTPLGGARTNGGNGRADREREIRMLRRAVRENSARIAKLERWVHWVAGGTAATISGVIVNTIRSLGGDGS